MALGSACAPGDLLETLDMMEASTTIRPAVPGDTDTIVELIRGLADYERLSDEARPDAERLREHLFGPSACAVGMTWL